MGDPGAIKAARSQVEQALEHIRNAAEVLRQDGWPETADDLMRSHKHLQVWTTGGWFDLMEEQRG